jgi:hypothetical protein
LLGTENLKKRQLEDYIKKNPEFAEKLKLLDELKQKEAEKLDKETAKNKK